MDGPSPEPPVSDQARPIGHARSARERGDRTGHGGSTRRDASPARTSASSRARARSSPSAPGSSSNGRLRSICASRAPSTKEASAPASTSRIARAPVPSHGNDETARSRMRRTPRSTSSRAMSRAGSTLEVRLRCRARNSSEERYRSPNGATAHHGAPSSARLAASSAASVLVCADRTAASSSRATSTRQSMPSARSIRPAPAPDSSRSSVSGAAVRSTSRIPRFDATARAQPRRAISSMCSRKRRALAAQAHPDHVARPEGIDGERCEQGGRKVPLERHDGTGLPARGQEVAQMQDESLPRPLLATVGRQLVRRDGLDGDAPAHLLDEQVLLEGGRGRHKGTGIVQDEGAPGVHHVVEPPDRSHAREPRPRPAREPAELSGRDGSDRRGLRVGRTETVDLKVQDEVAAVREPLDVARRIERHRDPHAGDLEHRRHPGIGRCGALRGKQGARGLRGRGAGRTPRRAERPRTTPRREPRRSGKGPRGAVRAPQGPRRARARSRGTR